MISIVIPALNAASGLPSMLAALVPGIVNGVLREVILVDGGSMDETLEIAEAAGLTLLHAEQGRGQQLHAGANAAKSDWLLFLRAGTILETGWEEEVSVFIKRIERGEQPEMAAAFRFALDDPGGMPRLLEWGVGWRCTLLGLPYADQGLLISRKLYDDVGGYRVLPLLEDVDLIHRLGNVRVAILRTAAISSAAPYKRDGYVWHMLRNWLCLLMFYCRVPIRYIVQLYGR